MTGTDQLHDAQKVLSDLRDHLARHDKPIAFLFGAGTSCAVKVPSPADKTKMQPLIPAVAGLTESCRQDGIALGGQYDKAWQSIEEQCKEKGLSPNVESVLSHVRMMLNAVGKADTLLGLKKDEIAKLEESELDPDFRTG